MGKHERSLAAVLAIAICLFPGRVTPLQAEDSPAKKAPEATTTKTAVATFAGGCFWCMEAAFDGIDGVIETTSGYTGGRTENPTYEEVSSGVTGHAESVRVTFDPSRITYAQLLALFWRNIDPLTPDAQFCDHGTQYRSAIFYQDEEQHRLAEASKAELQESGRFKQPIVTQIVAAGPFYPARNTTRTTTRRIRFGIASIGTAAAGMRVSKKCGARRPAVLPPASTSHRSYVYRAIPKDRGYTRARIRPRRKERRRRTLSRSRCR
jgi:peptide-methionine (S)-S-oxide reductase